MRRLLNTLYITTQRTRLSKERETIRVRIEGEKTVNVPIHNLQSIVCFGNISVTPYLMGMCGERGVGLTFLTKNGRFLARVEGPVSGNVLLRREQYRMADNVDTTLAIARDIVAAKIVNSRQVILRAKRECDSNNIKFDTPLKRATEAISQVRVAENIDTVRGLEGEAAKSYFSVFDELIKAEKEVFAFNGRNRRPPKDNINALLSFAYTLLVNDIRSALEGVGLDPAVGYLHAARPGRPSLALDMMEEFRAYICDRLVIAMINRGQIKGRGFNKTESGAVDMNDDTRKTLIAGYQGKKQEQVVHPFMQERMPVGMLLHAQAMLFARYIRGDLDAYPPFLFK